MEGYPEIAGWYRSRHYPVLDSKILIQALEEARRGGEVPLLPLMRPLRLEWWTKAQAIHRLIAAPPSLDTNELLSSLKPLVPEK